MHRLSEELKETANASVIWKIRRHKVLCCGYCRPHRSENRDCPFRRTDRYKDERKGRARRGIRTVRDPRLWEERLRGKDGHPYGMGPTDI
jgi:hypothetical protein